MSCSCPLENQHGRRLSRLTAVFRLDVGSSPPLQQTRRHHFLGHRHAPYRSAAGILHAQAEASPIGTGRSALAGAGFCIGQQAPQLVTLGLAAAGAINAAWPRQAGKVGQSPFSSQPNHVVRSQVRRLAHGSSTPTPRQPSRTVSASVLAAPKRRSALSTVRLAKATKSLS